MTGRRSIEFFDQQFRRPVTDAALALNPFEQLALPYLRGEVLDFGCGLGNLALAAASGGCTVTALDASPVAIAHLQARATAQGACVSAAVADLRDHVLTGEYDAIVSIGLLMFFDCATALRVLAVLQAHVRQGGVAVVNVLVEGTTFLDMFDPAGYCLFGPMELPQCFAGWTIERLASHDFEAPHGTLKRFTTVIARKPCEPLRSSGSPGPGMAP
jgi:tellurite methyltransferase